jgi:hypothetical protein
VTVESLTLTRIAGDEFFNLLSPAPGTSGTNPVTRSGTRDNIPVGYYLLRVVLRNSSGAAVGKSEAVHIYQNLTAKTALAEYTFTADDFRAYLVTNTNDSGPGSLRQAIIDAPAGQTIRVMLEPGSVIALDYYALRVTKSITIEGNGVILGQGLWNSSVINYDYVLLRIDDVAADVKISGVHFKNRSIDGYGIRNTGILTLESCIFSKEPGTRYFLDRNGGAIYSSNTLTIRGCTFYNNKGITGGAVYFDASGKTLTLAGNLFRDTTASDYPVVCVNSGTAVASYNVVDVDFGTGNTQCGWAQGTGDRLATALPISPITFRLYGNGATNVIATLPAGYPASDFYGNPISNGAAAGAVQASTGSGYYLELSVSNSLGGTVEVSPEPDEDGLVPSSISITADPNPGYTFGYWQAQGVQITNASTTLTLSEPTWIKAIFNRTVIVDNFSDGSGSATTPGTLRYALTNVENWDIINFTGVSEGTTRIELGSALPQVRNNITIHGNGVTLTWASSLVTPEPLLETWDSINNIPGVGIKISGVHFKNGLAEEGGAIFNFNGNLTLESCTFDGNTAEEGGAIYHYSNYSGVSYLGNLKLESCAFDGNTADLGGAIYHYGGNVTMESCTFNDNESTTGYGYGGAIYNGSGSAMTILDCAFDGNTAMNVGGAIDNRGSLTIESCTFNGNESTSTTTGSGYGGAIYNNAILTIRGSKFDGNTTGVVGGAIHNAGSLLLESCIFNGNKSLTGTGYGGAVYSTNSLTILGCTFYGNTAQSGGAVFVHPYEPSETTLTLTGNLFYGNSAVSIYDEVYVYTGTAVNVSYNVVDVAFGTGSSQCGWAQGTGDTYITGGIPIDTTSFAPNSGSPGINDIGIVPAGLSGFPTTDYYGATRTFPNGAAGAVK